MIKILTVIGARPQFVKASVVSQELAKHSSIEEIIIHTGQHFDDNMSAIFFSELNIPKPTFQFDINGGLHGEMTARMLTEIERVLLTVRPDFLMVYGDTNSTLAGALAAAKLNIPVIHVEAGLRSFNREMPEEINRIMTDHLSQLLFCPTQTAVANLKQEGFNSEKVHLVGDVMQDAALHFSEYSNPPNTVDINSNFILATLHRAENTNSKERFESIINALNTIHKTIAPVVLPIHPRTLKVLQDSKLDLDITLIEPLGYLEMLWCLKHCSLVLTDSGGTQKEAFFFNKPCVTMRDQTEWIELIDAGVNTLAGADSNLIVESVRAMINREIYFNPQLYGGGKASQSIVNHLLNL